MDYFLGCDWGTTSLRLWLAKTNDGQALALVKSDCGIAETQRKWQEDSGNREKRTAFYLDVVNQHVKKLEMKTGQSLTGLMLIISGMASSSIGMIDIPYASMPLPVDGTGVNTVFMPANSDFEHDVLIVSGARGNGDVMRGEETQLIGCIDAYESIGNELFIFPGTHSKHIIVKNSKIVSVQTYMTGEVFNLLAQQSILKNGVAAEGAFDLNSFKTGVNDSLKANLLHSIFKTRTNHLFDVYSKRQNYDYLSGLLIGAELNDLMNNDVEKINLVCASNLEIYYKTALAEFNLSKISMTFPAQWVDEAALRGQYKIGRSLKYLA